VTSWIPTAAAFANVAVMLLALTLVGVWLRRSTTEQREKRFFVAAAFASVAIKLGFASLGHNYDVEAYRLVGSIVERGLSVYANTDRYNYAPVWAWIVSGFSHLTGSATGEVFHLWAAAFLAAVDIIMALVIVEAYSWMAAMIFLLSPIGLLISGLHSQFDNLAVLLALLAWLLIRSGSPRTAAWVGSALTMSLSLMVKHVFFLFPAWLLFWKPLGKLRYRIFYMCIAYGLFLGSFLPWWSDPASRHGITDSVFRYSSFYGQSWLGYVIQMFVPISSFDTLLQWIPVFSGLKAVWVGLMMAGGIVLAVKGGRDLFIYYLMLLYASSPALAGQYAAIPIVATAVFCASWESWAFVAAGTLGNILTSSNASILLQRKLPEVVVSGHVFYITGVFDEYLQPFLLISSQFCIGALLLRQWRANGQPQAKRPLAIRICEATVLIAVGGLPVVLVKGVLGYFARALFS
jgi:hypothetical protein